MSVIVFTLCILAGSMLAGIVGALTGLGGGVILVPMLVLLFKVNVHYAVGASLMSVIATSSGATVVYLREAKAPGKARRRGRGLRQAGSPAAAVRFLSRAGGQTGIPHLPFLRSVP